MRFDWAKWRPIAAQEISHRRDVTKLVLHRTEGSTIAGAWNELNRRKVPSHGLSDLSHGIHLQLVDTAQAAQSLWHVDRDGCLQWEIVGFSRDTPNEPDEWYSQLAALINRICEPHLIPIELTGRDWPGPEGYGRLAPQRMSFDEFYEFEGILAHQHAPAKRWLPNRFTNSHWDVGALDVARLEALLPSATGDDEMFTTLDTGSQIFRVHLPGYGTAISDIANLAYWTGVVKAGRSTGHYKASSIDELMALIDSQRPESVELVGSADTDRSGLSDADVSRIATAVADEIQRSGAE